MSTHQTRKLKIAAACVAIALAGAAVGFWNCRAREAEMTEQLVRVATRATVAFDGNELRRLAESRTNPAASAPRTVKARLQRFKAIDPRVRSIYIFQPDPESGRVLLLADSGESETDDQTLPGSASNHAVRAAVWQAVQRTGEAAMLGPITDESGNWVATFAVIESPAGSVRGPTTLLGLEGDASGWNATLAQAWFQGAFYTWILLGLPLTAWLVVRRQHEQREVIRNLSEAMEQSHSAIMIVDLGSRIEYANRGLCQQMGYSRRELIGRPWRDFHVPQTTEAMLSDLVATVRSGRPWEGEWFNQRKDGSVFPVRGVVTPVKHRDGTLACFVAVFDDVTETKGREAELREARDAALAGDRAKGQFLATMSHEVRTPLNGIVGFTSLLLETPLTPEQREYVQTIRMSTEALIQLTGDILDFARIESGKLKLDPLACDPRECVEDALDLLAAKAAEKHVELLHRVGADVPAAVVTDGGRLRQVLVNLVGNAVKFTERGVVEVSVTIASPDRLPKAAAQLQPDEVLLQFTVRDTGIGIAPEHHTKLFRPFTQVDESTTRRYGGTGLGLAICRNLVELMGGTIAVASEVGAGAAFTFTIRANAAAPHAPARDLTGLRLGLAVRPGPLRAELAELLRSWHAEVIEVDDGGHLAPEQCDVALVEACHDIARDLAQQAPHGGLPVERTFGLVPISLSNELRTALRVHFRLLINKPVHHDALFALLSGSRANSALAAPHTHFGLRVLVVEDNPMNQRLVHRVLENLGCTSKLVNNGREALTQLAEHANDFDVVLLDLHMPEMDGLAALREIRAGRAGARAQTMWIIALTADAREQQRAKALEAGINDYLTKPLNLGELEQALKRFRNERVARKR